MIFADTLKRPLVNAIRYAFIVVGLSAAVNTVLAGSASSPGGGSPNPYSPEYGWLLHEWAISFAVASVALLGAFVLSRGWFRWLMIIVLVLTWSNGIRPAWHLVDYYGVTHR
jgi:hypothetical protein